MPPNRGAAFETAPLDELFAVLLRQYRRPLATRGVELSDADAAALAKRMAERDVGGSALGGLRAALGDLVAESEAVLAAWNLTYAESVDRAMDALPGWETTAEFLDLAERKTNAELRIALGAILLLALGDERRLDIVRWLAQRAASDADLDTVLARRALALWESP
jgi:hypothetical protein